MSQLNLNFTLDEAIKRNRRCLAEGNQDEVFRSVRKAGKWYILIGFVACAVLAYGIVYSVTHYMSFMNVVAAIVFGLCIAAFIGLIIYGIKCTAHPEQNNSYQKDYLRMVDTISRNTGYPNRPYAPEQWEIPFSAYSPEVLQSILNIVGGWGQDNTFFISNVKFNRSRTVHVEDAHIFNLCEKGLFLIPISLDADGCKAYVDLCTMVPTSEIARIGLYPSIYAPVNQDDMELAIISNNVVWDIHNKGNDMFAHSTLTYQVKRRIDGAPFHEYNVNKLFQLYGSANRLEDIRKARKGV